MGDAGLISAAQHERDRRGESYPAKIAAGANPEPMIVDYQAWCGIAEWLETDRFVSTVVNEKIVSWPELELAAVSALTSVTDKLNLLEAQAAAVGMGGAASKGIQPEKLGAQRQRRSCLFVIHRAVQLRRQSIDIINAELRARQSQPEGIAA